MKIKRFTRKTKKIGKFQAIWKKIYPHHKVRKWGFGRQVGWFIAVVFFGLVFYGVVFLPSVSNASQLAFAESTIIYDRGALDPEEDPNDHILYVIHGDENREHVPLSEIPQAFIPYAEVLSLYQAGAVPPEDVTIVWGGLGGSYGC
jgi:membrane peptidoglycan carboxypeptidase